jgi:GT2 family glycosyltransferase
MKMITHNQDWEILVRTDGIYDTSNKEQELFYIAEQSKADIIVFDYYKKKNGIKTPVNVFTSRAGLGGGAGVPVVVLARRNMFSDRSWCAMVAAVLAGKATISVIREYRGIVQNEIQFSHAIEGRNATKISGFCGDRYAHTRHIDEDVAIVILSSNSTRLDKCLGCIKRGTPYLGFYGDQDFLKRYNEMYGQRYSVDMFENTSRFNFSHLNNTIIHRHIEGRYKYVLLLNDDVYMMEHFDWINEMLCACHEENASIVGASLYYPDFRYQHAGIIMGDGNNLFEHVGRGKKHDKCFYPTREVNAVTFACALINVDLYKELNGLDEQYYGDCNDVDFCFRAKKRGVSIWYCAEAMGIHEESATRMHDPNMANDINTRLFYEANQIECRKVFNLL